MEVTEREKWRAIVNKRKTDAHIDWGLVKEMLFGAEIKSGTRKSMLEETKAFLAFVREAVAKTNDEDKEKKGNDRQHKVQWAHDAVQCKPSYKITTIGRFLVAFQVKLEQTEGPLIYFVGVNVPRTSSYNNLYSP